MNFLDKLNDDCVEFCDDKCACECDCCKSKKCLLICLISLILSVILIIFIILMCSITVVGTLEIGVFVNTASHTATGPKKSGVYMTIPWTEVITYPKTIIYITADTSKSSDYKKPIHAWTKYLFYYIKYLEKVKKLILMLLFYFILNLKMLWMFIEIMIQDIKVF